MPSQSSDQTYIKTSKSLITEPDSVKMLAPEGKKTQKGIHLEVETVSGIKIAATH